MSTRRWGAARALATAALGVCTASCAAPAADRAAARPSPPRPATVATAPPPGPPRIEAGVAPAAPAAEVATSDPATDPPPRIRREGGLLVESPPRHARDPNARGRLRTDVAGALSVGARRVWVGIDVPAYVKLTIGSTELFLLDRTPDGLLAFYREPYGAATCTLGSATNCTFSAVLYDARGAVAWEAPLSKLLSRPDHLEIQDVRYDSGVLYFNEACQSYSREAGGRCSSLVAYDPEDQRVLWRTPPLTSNGVFLVAGKWIVCGYGFTDEPDHLFVVRRTDGAVVARASLPTAHDGLAIDEGAGVLRVHVYLDRELSFRMEGWDGDRPRLAPLPSPPPAQSSAPRPPSRR